MNEDFTKTARLQLSIGHLLVIWDVLANKAAKSGLIEALDDDEQRAIWALEDLCERSLMDQGIAGRPEAEWQSLMERARAHVRSIPVDFLD